MTKKSTLLLCRVREQLPRPAPDREVRQQDQHELRVQQRRGGRAGGAYLVPVVAGLHNQVRAAGAQKTHAPEGEHETQSASRGLLLLDVVCVSC